MVLTKNNIEKLEGLFLNHLKTSKITEVICMHGNKESIFQEINRTLNVKSTESNKKEIQDGNRKIRHVFILHESDSE